VNSHQQAVHRWDGGSFSESEWIN